MRREETKDQLMTVQMTCSECGSGVHIYPSGESKTAKCDVCHHLIPSKRKIKQPEKLRAFFKI